MAVLFLVQFAMTALLMSKIRIGWLVSVDWVKDFHFGPTSYGFI